MKELEIYMTHGIQDLIQPSFLVYFSSKIRSLFADHPVDMFVFENDIENNATIRLAGYYFGTNVLNETSVIFKAAFQLPAKFWFKIDDYDDRYIGVFLLPSEY